MKRKGKGKSKAILSDDDEAGYADKSEVPSVGADADVSIGLASKENIHPHLGEIPQQSKPSTKVSPPPGLEIAARGRSTSIKPSIKPTPMSELIKRVNSQPGSPFAHSPRPAPIYSPYLKSSRSLLSRIAPLHPNRRTPPPPLPRPPPPKKSKKQLQMEERIEEELAETIEGWSCMTNEERKELKRARIDLELGGYD
ncbi:hypothetical protein SERLA73DRAFT_181542 [Serpula lacrymans var. lacrymans S7.3]|uniref:Uncharacterized protein n=2 Tax=Serpula lacrymans var. lacrymans TaxID=341189 RepID=F8PY92_SERL3|nr:hypothetical protein SERLA73DRAFT_181542 [Serpula lacrymans var. lacrymans S7.3]